LSGASFLPKFSDYAGDGHPDSADGGVAFSHGHGDEREAPLQAFHLHARADDVSRGNVRAYERSLDVHGRERVFQ
jgi:hypothetical protein